ncbi:MAG: hypothetical protein H0V24_15185 [Chloroflexia bacterium]|nr:hypothetical protein [Chloroflexia bacterium]
MNETDVVLTGLPRSGTTLTCSLLNKLPDTVALHEPMQGVEHSDVTDHHALAQDVKRFFDEQRASIHERGRALSRNIDGVVPDNPFGGDRSAKGVRPKIDAMGEIDIDKVLSDRFMLVIKHTNRFAPMLEGLVELFPVYALVRNPVATIASWGTIEAGLRRGRSGPAGRVALDLNERMDRFDDPLDRQICLLGWFFEQFHRHLPERSIIQYETLVASGGRALSVVRPEAAQLDEPLTSRNTNELYDHQQMLRIGERLLKTDGAYWESYSKAQVEQLLGELEQTAPA